MDRKFTNFDENLIELKRNCHVPIIPISAKEGTNLELFIETIKEIVD